MNITINLTGKEYEALCEYVKTSGDQTLEGAVKELLRFKLMDYGYDV